MTSAAPTTNTQQPASLDVFAVLRSLLAQGDNDAVIALFTKLLATHTQQLRDAIESARRRSTKNEGVDTATLLQLFKQVEQLPPELPTTEADAKLKDRVGDVEIDKKKHGPPKPPPRRRPIPPELPRVLNEIVVPSAERACPVCGGVRVCIGHEVTEVIDIEPARVIVRQDKREKIACEACDGQVARAPLGDKVIEGGVYGSQLVADMVVGKYVDGLPLHRQHERYERLGLDMPSSSMCDQITWATDLLQPISEGIFKQVLASGTMHLDATSLPVLDRDYPTGIRIGALWGYVGVDIRILDGFAVEDRRAAYLYTCTGKKVGQREGELGPEEVLELRRLRGLPHVVADAANLFDKSFAKPGLIEVGCNMHGRRYFSKALDAKDVRAALPIAAFKKLYEIEERLTGKPPAERLRVRQAESKPIYDDLLIWCDAYRKVEPPSSLLGKAVRYLTNHKTALMRFLDDGTLPIDNGVVERLHRRAAIGRRNYLFAGSNAGAERAAIAYTVLGTCRLLGINPIEYLADVLPKLARGCSSDLATLMPEAWLRARTPTAAPASAPASNAG